MELIFARHALPMRVDRPEDAAPVANPGLSARGQVQATRLGEYLAGEHIDAMYSSPVRRALETAEQVGSVLGLGFGVNEGLAEWDAAARSYIPIEEMQRSGHPWWQALKSGDFYDKDADPADFRRVVVDAVEAIVGQHPGQRVVLVTHAGPINAYAGEILGQPKPYWMPLTRSPGYCSITRIKASSDGERRVISLNEVAHVRDLLHN